MTNIAFAFNYSKFDEVKGCTTTHEMWSKLKDIY